MVYTLAQHPKIFLQAKEEIIRLFDADGDPDYRIMRDSKFLRAIINETLR